MIGGVGNRSAYSTLPHHFKVSMEGQDITLTYFDAPGRAFPTRISLLIAGVKFTDERLDYAKFQELKATNKERFPFGLLPVLTINGEYFVESGAQSRWAGRLAGLYPSKPMDQLRVDELWDVIESIFSGIKYSADPAEKQRLREEYRSGKLMTILGFLNEKIKATSAQGPLFMGCEMCIADLKLYASYLLFESGFIDHISSDVFSGFPEILGLFEAVKAHPVVAEHLSKK